MPKGEKRLCIVYVELFMDLGTGQAIHKMLLHNNVMDKNENGYTLTML